MKAGPDDPRYADLILRGHNARFRGKPDYVHLVGATEHVVQAVGEAVQAGKRIAVRSGGHCFENFVDNPDVQVVIDMSGMSAIYFDSDRNAFAVESGATLWQVFQTLYMGWGVTIPGGNCGGVGVGGHLCGGGYGPLSRLLGSVVDYIYGVEVVVVGGDGTAKAVVATREADDPNHDLWWAHTGGGGGNFGVVTRYWLRSPDAVGNEQAQMLPKPPARMLTTTAIWSWDGMAKDSFTTLLGNHGTWFENNSGPGSPYAALFSGLVIAPRAAGPEPGGPIMISQIDATLSNAKQLLDDYIAAVSNGVEPAQMFELGEQPWLESVRTMRSGEEDVAAMFKDKAAYLRKRYTDAQIGTLYDYLAGANHEDEQGQLLFMSYGGQVNTVAPEATALPQRDSILKVMYTAYWEDPAAEDRHLTWIRELYRDVYADTGGVPAPSDANDGSYINYPDTDLADPEWNTSDVPWYALYYKDSYPRLQQVKTKWDPQNIFHHALSIQPA